MEFKTLSHIHLVTTASAVSDPIAAGVFYSFTYRLLPPEDMEQTFRYIFSQAVDQPFTITLQLNDGFDDWDNKSHWLDKLCLILCHPLYIRQNNQQLIGLIYTSGDRPQKQAILQQISEKLQQQGFNNLLTADLSDLSQAPLDNLSYILFNEEVGANDFYNWYMNHLVQSHSLLHIFAVINNEETTEQVQELKRKAEEELQAKQPVLYRLLYELQSKSAEVYQYQSLVEMLIEDLSSKKNYLDFLLGKFKEGGVYLNETMKLKKFYHQEYEILPLWYKQFGHIIKVVTGKRTFKSLFNDNVKKYKD